MILEVHRFRYSAGSDLAIGRDDQGRLFYQQWGPHPETGAPAEQPLGWQPYAIHHGQEEAEELLRLKAELDLLKSDDERHYGAVARPEQELAEQQAACEELEAMLVPHAEPGESAPDTLRRLFNESREVDAGAVREVIARLRRVRKTGTLALHAVEPAIRLHCDTLADRLDAALGGQEAENRAPRKVDALREAAEEAVGAIRGFLLMHLEQLDREKQPLAGAALAQVVGELQTMASNLDAALGRAGEGRELAADDEPCDLEEFYERESADRRHQDLVTLAAGSLAGQRATACRFGDLPRLWSSEEVAVRAEKDASLTLAAIERAEKGQEG